ncbi:MBL fold metallo-hydrolase [Lichenicola cladoniae]|uniref:MBL fold metallo-hydrolase n=1 Tax=Lichenicola cladoniae TaxID=1484109 RepID=A0A6M8HFC0_9PROT|nr:MBL fold metallo-hydrolase [Lichenicola cladoniae]NPD66742.1 MBL fold metallo-hydrolase [Acetobacteraceae bacterium]QKE88687.1 MBL fold metallo-hydrolase [Lichenicola cladoniae]
MTVTRLLLPDRLADWLAGPIDGLALAWLGQAGFVLRLGTTVVLVDPYLSDHLAIKYSGTRFPHARMMPAPIAPDGFPRVDLVVCTHRHSDHMDPGTLPVLATSHPECRFVVPASEQAHAERLGLPPSRTILAEAGQSLRPLPGIDLTLHPVPAAHEQLERDEQGRYRFLGYCIEADRRRLYHSGDCIPYEGLVETLRTLAPDLALLPVNGRDAERAAAGVPGNFTLDEAVALCGHANISTLIPHHFGMFAFNTADPESIDAMAVRQAELGLQPGLLRPDARHAFLLGREKPEIRPVQQQEHDVDRG